MDGAIIGIVIRNNLCMFAAPSIFAASYNSSGMLWRPAKNITTHKPIMAQTVAMIIAIFVIPYVSSQFIGGRFKRFKIILIMPLL